MTILRDISSIWASCFSLVLFLVLFQSRYTLKKTLIITISVMVPLLAVNFALLFFLGPETMSLLLLLTSSLPSMIYFWFMSKYRDGRFFFAFCFCDTLVLELMHITLVLDYYLGNTYIFMFVARLVLYPLLTLLVYKLLRPTFVSVQSKVRKGWYSFTAISVIFYVVLSLTVSYPDVITGRPEYFPAFILLLVLMPMMYVNIFTTLRHQQRIHEITEQDHIMQLQMANMTARVEEFSAADEKFRIERHNFRHKMQTIRQLIDSKQYDDLAELVDEYADAIADSQVHRYCGSPVIDAVLASYLQRAENKGIQVITSIAFPESIPVSETELATVFANAIENAINACEKITDGSRFIKVQVLSVPRLMIQISNSCPAPVELDENGVPVCKEEGHGFGTRSIVGFCEKNNALYEFKNDRGTFALRLVFG